MIAVNQETGGPGTSCEANALLKPSELVAWVRDRKQIRDPAYTSWLWARQSPAFKTTSPIFRDMLS